MINVDEIFSKVKSIIAKNSNGYLSPAEFNRYANMAQLNLFNRYYGSPKGYQYDKPLPRTAYAITQDISEALATFIDSQIIEWDDESLPSSMLHIIDVSHSYDLNGTDVMKSLRRVEWNRRNSWLNDPIDAPTNAFPIYTERDHGRLDVFPTTIQYVNVTYLRRPSDVTWGYTISSGLPVYDPGNSIDFEWNANEENNLVFEICSLASVGFKDNDVMAYSENFKKGGDA